MSRSRNSRRGTKRKQRWTTHPRLSKTSREHAVLTRGYQTGIGGQGCPCCMLGRDMLRMAHRAARRNLRQRIHHTQEAP